MRPLPGRTGHRGWDPGVCPHIQGLGRRQAAPEVSRSSLHPAESNRAPTPAAQCRAGADAGEQLGLEGGSFGWRAGGRAQPHLRWGSAHGWPVLLQEAECGLDETSPAAREGRSWRLAGGGQAVGGAAEPQVGGGAVGRVLAPSRAAVPVAVGLCRGEGGR